MTETANKPNITTKTRQVDNIQVNDIYVNGQIYTRAVGNTILDEIIQRVIATTGGTYSG